MRARRALLYMPGDDLKKIQKGTTLGVDCVCLDIEDGVAANRKNEARLTASEALKTMDFGRSERLARINAVGSGLEYEDLRAALAGRPDGIVVPKVEDAWQVRWASEQIAEYERELGWTTGGIRVIIQAETARGIVNLPAICSADPRIEAVIFGAEDFANDIGATRSHDGLEVFYARSAVVTHCAAFGLQAIDMVYVNFHDNQGLVLEAKQGAHMGFDGKQIIHPSQVDPVQDAFTPSIEAIAYALRVIEADAQHQQRGFGAFTLDGKMIDAPVVKAAARVLARAQAAGKFV
jgi:citrate lyase beta subunit